jgi:hypothetical protein
MDARRPVVIEKYSVHCANSVSSFESSLARPLLSPHSQSHEPCSAAEQLKMLTLFACSFAGPDVIQRSSCETRLLSLQLTHKSSVMFASTSYGRLRLATQCAYIRNECTVSSCTEHLQSSERRQAGAFELSLQTTKEITK